MATKDNLINCTVNMLITHIINHPDCYTTIADWYMSFWGKNYPERTNAGWVSYIGKHTDRLPITLIALDDSTTPPTLIGTASIRLNGMDNCPSNTAWLSGVYVPPEHRGKKIATAIIKEAIKVASEQYNQLYLFTRTDGRIYKNLGWQTISETECQESTVSVMRRSLAPKIKWHMYSEKPAKISLEEKTNMAQTNATVYQIQAKL
jgi:GNAT superfamily N-acetyltransferase